MRKKYQSTKITHDSVQSIWRSLCFNLWRWEMREAPVINSDQMLLDAICSPSTLRFLREVREVADVSFMSGNEYTEVTFHNNLTVTLHIIDRANLPLPLNPELQNNDAGRKLTAVVDAMQRANQIVAKLTDTFDKCRGFAKDYQHLRLMLSSAPIIWEAAGRHYPGLARDPDTFNSRWAGTLPHSWREDVAELDGYFLNLSFILRGGLDLPPAESSLRVRQADVRWD